METTFAVKRATTNSRSQSGSLRTLDKACYRCSDHGHDPTKCRFKNYTCLFCKTKGHIAKACRKKQRDNAKDSTEGNWRTKRKPKTQSTYQVDAEDVSLICSLSGRGGVKVTIEVAGRNVEMEVDTGASVSVVPTQMYNEVLSHVQLKKSTAQLQSYSGERLKVKGEAVVPIKYGKQQSMERLIVVDVSDKPAVLGRDWLSNLKLDWASLFKVDSGVFDVPEKYPQLFAEGVGTLEGYQAKITLSADAKPQFHRPRPVPHALQQKVEEELNRLQEEGIIQPVENSEWAAPIVIVRKADNSIRICGDYKVTINPYLEMDNYPMPNAQNLFASLAGGRSFTRLDMKQAYMQMRVDASSQRYFDCQHCQRPVCVHTYALWYFDCTQNLAASNGQRSYGNARSVLLFRRHSDCGPIRRTT